MKIKNYAMKFYGRISGDFSVSPQEYHRTWRKQVGARKAYVGPWDYAGISSKGLRSKYVSPQEQPKTASPPRGGFLSPSTASSSKYAKSGYVSPVDDLQVTKKKVYSTGANRTQALSEE